MTRSDDLELILRPWLERNAPPAPDDLLPRVMREVDTMSQRTRTWPSSLATTPVGGWLAAAAVVTVLAVAIGLLVFGPNGSPVGGPNPTATPTVRTTPSPSPVPSFAPPASAQEAIDGVITTWNQRDVAQLHHYYAQGATVRIVNGSTEFTESYAGLPAIAGTLQSSSRTGCTITRTGESVHQGSTWANPFRYACTNGSVAGFAVFRVGEDNRVINHWAILRTAGAVIPPVAAPAEVVAFFDGCDAATNREDYTTLNACYAPDADHRASVANITGSWSEIYTGIDAITTYHAGGASVEFRLHRTGAIVEVGDLFAYPLTYSQRDGGGNAIAVFRLSADRTQIINEWIFAD